MIRIETQRVSIDEIEIVPQIRKFKKISQSKIKELAQSIQNFGLFHPIVVTTSVTSTEPPINFRLVLGEHRLRAIKYLYSISAPCKWPQFSKWTCIPARLVDFSGDLAGSVDSYEIAMQIEENIKRSPLYWKDEARAIHAYHNSRGESSTVDSTAQALSMSPSHVGRVISVARAVLSSDQDVIAAETLTAAINICERKAKRSLEDQMEQIELMEHSRKEDPKDPQIAESTPAQKPKPAPKYAHSIIQDDFCQWAKHYSGRKFNFIHCDFPYGINHHKSAQGKTKEWGAYDDSEKVYWRLIETLAEHRDSLMTRSAHIMFWFSMKHYIKTIEKLRKYFPSASVNPFPLVWHKSDNVGIIPDPRHTPRQIYETALLISLNKREIIRAVSNLYAAPKSTKTHASEKPVSVLHHFYRMFLDANSRVLDPTCGSGNSIIATLKFNITEALGIEMNPNFAKEAQRNLSAAIRLERAAKWG